MTEEITIERLKELAGIKDHKNKCVVLLPAESPIEEMRSLIKRLFGRSSG